MTSETKPKVKKDSDFDYNGEWHVRYKGEHYVVFFDRGSSAWFLGARFLSRPDYAAFGPGSSHMAGYLQAYNKNEVIALIMAAVETGDEKIRRWRER